MTGISPSTFPKNYINCRHSYPVAPRRDPTFATHLINIQTYTTTHGCLVAPRRGIVDV